MVQYRLRKGPEACALSGRTTSRPVLATNGWADPKTQKIRIGFCDAEGKSPVLAFPSRPREFERSPSGPAKRNAPPPHRPSSPRGPDRTGTGRRPGLTKSTVRMRFSKLEESGLVEVAGRRPTRRKPEHVYDLTGEAEALFRTSYEPLLNTVVAVVSAREGTVRRTF